MRYGKLGSQPVDIVEISVRLVFVLLFQLGFVKGRIAEGLLGSVLLFVDGRGLGLRRGGLGQTGLLDSLSFASGDRSGLSGGFGVRTFARVSRGRMGKGYVLVLRCRDNMSRRNKKVRWSCGVMRCEVCGSDG